MHVLVRRGARRATTRDEPPETDGVSALRLLQRSLSTIRTHATSRFAIPILLGAALGYLALRDAPEVPTLSVLA